MQSAYLLHPSAVDDIQEILDYLAGHNRTAASVLLDEFLDAFLRIAKFSHLGHQRPDITAKPIRFVLLNDFLIAYLPESKPTFILAVIHGRRNPRVIAAVLQHRKLGSDI